MEKPKEKKKDDPLLDFLETKIELAILRYELASSYDKSTIQLGE